MRIMIVKWPLFTIFFFFFYFQTTSLYLDVKVSVLKEQNYKSDSVSINYETRDLCIIFCYYISNLCNSFEFNEICFTSEFRNPLKNTHVNVERENKSF